MHLSYVDSVEDKAAKPIVWPHEVGALKIDDEVIWLEEIPELIVFVVLQDSFIKHKKKKKKGRKVGSKLYLFLPCKLILSSNHSTSGKKIKRKVIIYITNSPRLELALLINTVMDNLM